MFIRKVLIAFFRFFIDGSFRGFIFATAFIKPAIMDFKMKNVHIGEMIRGEMRQQGRTVSWLATQICCENSNIYKMYKRKSIDLEQLMKISEALGHNFLRDCFEEKTI